MSNKLITSLVGRGLVDASAAELGEEGVVAAVNAGLNQRDAELQAVKAAKTQADTELEQIKAQLAETRKASALAEVEAAVAAVKIKPLDEGAKTFWVESLIEKPELTRKALASFPVSAALTPVVRVTAENAGSSNGDRMARQKALLAEVRAAHPKATGDEVFRLAQDRDQSLFVDAD